MRDMVRKALLGGVIPPPSSAAKGGGAKRTQPFGLLLGGGMILMGTQLGIPILTQAASKYAIILQAGKESHEGMARAVHAFLYAKELKEHGHEVVLIFDGAGTEWAEELSSSESPSKLKPMYEQLKQAGITEIICDFCAGAFAVKDRLSQRQLPLVAEYEGHPSIAKWVDDGYEILIL